MGNARASRSLFCSRFAVRSVRANIAALARPTGPRLQCEAREEALPHSRGPQGRGYRVKRGRKHCRSRAAHRAAATESEYDSENLFAAKLADRCPIIRRPKNG